VEEALQNGSRRPGVLRLALATGVCLMGGAIVLVALMRARPPADDSPDAGFARDMATHHAQAAEMSFVVRDASSDARLRALAYDIIVTQTAQRGILMGWLQQWALPQSSTGPRMAWMAGHVHGHMGTSDGGEAMPGMASAVELERLRHAAGTDAEVLFLQLMIRHHEGGVAMARALLMQSRREEVLSLARSIESGQTGEIALMTAMLAERGAQPYPTILATPTTTAPP
jgi:uncharacterized protein (DUF305 family)